MADIYDLVQRGLAQGKASQSQFTRGDQPWADLTLDIVKTIQTQKDRKNIADRAQLSDILDLTQVASSEKGFASLDSVLNSFEPSDELIPAYTAVKTNAAQRKNNYYKGKAAFSEISGNLGVYEDYTKEEIKGWDIGKLKDEIIKVAELNDNILMATKNNFNYGGDIGLRRVGRAALDYHDKLNNTLQALASEGIITDEEAEAIFLGNFQETRRNVISSSLKQISALDNDIDSLTNLMIKAKGDGAYDTLMAAISQQTGQDVTQETLAQQYSNLIEFKEARKGLIQKRYNSWSPITYAPEITMEDIEKEKLERKKKLAEDFAKLNVINKDEGATDSLKGKKVISSKPGGELLSYEKESIGIKDWTIPKLKKLTDKVNNLKTELNEAYDLTKSKSYFGVKEEVGHRDPNLLEELLNRPVGSKITMDDMHSLIGQTENMKIKIEDNKKILTDYNDVYGYIDKKEVPEEIQKDYYEKKRENARLKTLIKTIQSEKIKGSPKKMIKKYKKLETELALAEKELKNFKIRYKVK